ncbi:hypothetical protein [Aureivirga sp. CE67]|uniref:hypothetical protein n=1 Tax=Aureivirga sp. CE67 TaxID=1788983 RepID=UPI0018C9D472|nr:hypothetical protein [Aureivirga sp. CE67]
MEVKDLKIESHLDTSEIIDRLEKLNGKESFLTAVSGKKLYTGTIKKEKISLRTFSSPPVEITGFITEKDNNKELNIKLKAESNKASSKGLIYALCYPILSVIIFLNIYNNPKSVIVYILCALSLFIPMIIYKVDYFINQKPLEPNLDSIIKTIEKQFK